MLKKLGAPSFLVAALCGYMVMMTPDWKNELHAQAGYYDNFDINATYKGSTVKERAAAE